ncbi:TRAP transporter large permease [Pusillimonas sp. NJUB218]|uniref:TRAP transporter large permease n=1 Tax=Pusillimonas sp. NJUB218 TaxID=2023230 RepID=UPI000F4C072C|nr:TRAP transporter large permease [Pusillimonas sp. NJUB218]ROT46589.1 C4-dicarboxylate ABC transporter permease [Pusillimonas sp. NJUB218]
MTELHIGLLLIAGMVVFVAIGMEIGVALLGLSFVGVWLVRDNWDVAERLLAMAAYSGIQDYLFATIPLFVLMGMLVAVSGIGKDTFAVAEWALRRVLGGLGMATVMANTIFAAVTGISIASAAVFTRVAVPEMLKYGYTPQFAVGTVAGSSILGMLIPPSLLMIIYGVVAEQSIGKMFIAGVVPGILMAVAFCLTILILAKFFPRFTFAKGRDASASVKALQNAMTGAEAARLIFPVILLVVLVLGGLYAGIFTPTEAGGVGAFFALAIALARGRLGLKSFWRILVETGLVSVSILFLIIAANMYSRMLTMAGVPDAVAGLLGALGPEGFLLAYIVVIILLGMILDSSSIILIVVPIAVPIARVLGFDLIHFGIVTLIAVEIGLLTPPLGLSAFAVKSSLNDPRVPLGTVFYGAMPFVVAMLAVMAVIVAFPALVTSVVQGS